MSRRHKTTTKERAKNHEEEKGSQAAAGKYTEMFQEYRKELNASQDKHERLVKLSRDCTIHSKRAIFTLHQFSGSHENKDKVLSEAEAEISKDVLPLLHSIAVEIGDTDPHKHHRAYSPGIQEFIEAVAYHKYLKSGRLISFDEAQKLLTFQAEVKETEPEEIEKSDAPKDVLGQKGNGISVQIDPSSLDCNVLPLTAVDFILGLADLTGELMRLCINAVGSGNRELPFSLLPFFRALFNGFHSFGSEVKYMNQKMAVLRTSLGKVENVCYTLTVRGSEMPKHNNYYVDGCD